MMEVQWRDMRDVSSDMGSDIPRIERGRMTMNISRITIIVVS